MYGDSWHSTETYERIRASPPRNNAIDILKAKQLELIFQELIFQKFSVDNGGKNRASCLPRVFTEA